jgi:Ferredoxin
VLEALKAAAKQEGVADRFEILDGGCVGMCGLGPNALVMSGRTRIGYSKLKPEDAREIIIAHKGDDKPVERLRTKNFRK